MMCLYGCLDSFATFTSTFLDAPDEFVLFALNKLKVVVGELRPLLLEVTFYDVPISFYV